MSKYRKTNKFTQDILGLATTLRTSDNLIKATDEEFETFVTFYDTETDQDQRVMRTEEMDYLLNQYIDWVRSMREANHE